MLAAAAAPVAPGPVFLVPYTVVADRIDTSLTGAPGDPARGKILFADRQISTCVLCHADPSTPPPPGGAIGPSLAGVGSRLSEGQIRLRIVDSSRVAPETIMPSFYVVAGLVRVGRAWQGKPVLDAAQIEDIVAWLATLRSP
jgi:sulfur-oxidizing protein SoxX